MGEQLLTTIQVAEILGLKPSHLERLRHQGKGPACIKARGVDRNTYSDGMCTVYLQRHTVVSQWCLRGLGPHSGPSTTD